MQNAKFGFSIGSAGNKKTNNKTSRGGSINIRINNNKNVIFNRTKIQALD